MATSREAPQSPPRLHRRAAIVGIAVAVGAILNGLAELGSFCYVAWMLVAIPVLALLAVISVFQVLGELGGGRRAHAVARAWQLALAVAAIVVLPMLGEIHDLLEVAKVRSRLYAEAWASPDRPGPHIAVVQTGDFLSAVWGYAYDDSGEIAKPCGLQSELWRQRASEARLGNFDCAANVSHVIGAYYFWGQN